MFINLLQARNLLPCLKQLMSIQLSRKTSLCDRLKIILEILPVILLDYALAEDFKRYMKVE